MVQFTRIGECYTHATSRNHQGEESRSRGGRLAGNGVFPVQVAGDVGVALDSSVTEHTTPHVSVKQAAPL